MFVFTSVECKRDKRDKDLLDALNKNLSVEINNPP